MAGLTAQGQRRKDGHASSLNFQGSSVTQPDWQRSEHCPQNAQLSFTRRKTCSKYTTSENVFSRMIFMPYSDLQYPQSEHLENAQNHVSHIIRSESSIAHRPLH